LDTLIAAERHYRTAFPAANPAARVGFVKNCLEALARPVPALAQDAMPIGLSRDQEPKRDEHGRFAATQGYKEVAHTAEKQPWQWSKKIAEHKNGITHHAHITRAGVPEQFIARRTFSKPGFSGARVEVGRYPSFRAAHEAVVKAISSLPSAKDLAMPNNSNMLQGYGSNALRGVERRRARDQMYERNDLGVGPEDVILDQGSPADFGPEELGEIVRRCLAGFADRDGANDAEGEASEHNQAMQVLADVLREAHANGNGGMDKRRRTGRDQMPPNAAPPRNLSQRGSFTAGTEGARDRALAQDTATRYRNMATFFTRFPDAARISIRG
jgi:hypothetical protein